MRKFYLLLVSAIILNTLSAECQKSHQEAGIRAGYRGGLFYQTTGRSGNATTGIQALATFAGGGLQITGLRVIYATSINNISPDLYFGWGYGGHAGFLNVGHDEYISENFIRHETRFTPVVGADGWVTLEYRFREVPVNLSLNLKPFIEIGIPSLVSFVPGDLGISVSYVF